MFSPRDAPAWRIRQIDGWRWYNALLTGYGAHPGDPDLSDTVYWFYVLYCAVLDAHLKVLIMESPLPREKLIGVRALSKIIEYYGLQEIFERWERIFSPRAES